MQGKQKRKKKRFFKPDEVLIAKGMIEEKAKGADPRKQSAAWWDDLSTKLNPRFHDPTDGNTWRRRYWNWARGGKASDWQKQLSGEIVRWCRASKIKQVEFVEEMKDWGGGAGMSIATFSSRRRGFTRWKVNELEAMEKAIRAMQTLQKGQAGVSGVVQFNFDLIRKRTAKPEATKRQMELGTDAGATAVPEPNYHNIHLLRGSETIHAVEIQNAEAERVLAKEWRRYIKREKDWVSPDVILIALSALTGKPVTAFGSREGAS